MFTNETVPLELPVLFLFIVAVSTVKDVVVVVSIFERIGLEEVSVKDVVISHFKVVVIVELWLLCMSKKW